MLATKPNTTEGSARTASPTSIPGSIQLVNTLMAGASEAQKTKLFDDLIASDALYALVKTDRDFNNLIRKFSPKQKAAFFNKFTAERLSALILEVGIVNRAQAFKDLADEFGERQRTALYGALGPKNIADFIKNALPVNIAKNFNRVMSVLNAEQKNAVHEVLTANYLPSCIAREGNLNKNDEFQLMVACLGATQAANFYLRLSPALSSELFLHPDAFVSLLSCFLEGVFDPPATEAEIACAQVSGVDKKIAVANELVMLILDKDPQYLKARIKVGLESPDSPLYTALNSKRLGPVAFNGPISFFSSDSHSLQRWKKAFGVKEPVVRGESSFRTSSR